MTVTLFVPGVPIAQPRVKARTVVLGYDGPYKARTQARVYTPKTAEAWKEAIRLAFLAAAGPEWEVIPHGTPVCCEWTARFPRPNSHYRTGRNAHLLRDKAPKRLHFQKPDRDNLEKAIFDALNGAAWHDDAQVCRGEPIKEWADRPDPCGLWLSVGAVQE